jgi:hypothetical protein
VYEAVEFGQLRIARPDVTVSQPEPRAARAPAGVLTIAPAPEQSRVPIDEPLVLNRVEIRALPEQQLVTVIEILSPANKRPGSEDQATYLQKRRTLLRAAVHLMEIDLLRGGQWPPLERPVSPASYYVTLSRWDRRPAAEVWPIGLEQALPALPVPLLPPDPDVALDLGDAVASVYEGAGYATQIDYRQPLPPPPLSAEDAAWVEAVLAERRTG